MICMFCGTTEESNFSLYHNNLICDDCLSVMNHYYKEAFKDIEKVWHEHEPQYRSIGLWESSFLEGLEQYVSIKQMEYNDKLREERMNQWQK